MYYQKLIQEILGCNPADACAIEQMVRNTYGSMSHLSREEIAKEAKICAQALVADFGLRRLLLDQAGV